MHSEQNRKKPIPPIHLLLQLVSLVLCILLAVNLLATVFIFDLRALTSSGGIRTILDSLITSDTGSEEPALLAPLPAANGLSRLNVTTSGAESGEEESEEEKSEEEKSEEEKSEEEEMPQLSADLLTDPDALAAYMQSLAQGILGEETDISTEQVQTFINESTVMDFVSDKMSDYISDVLTGEQNASITSQDIMDLLEENEALLEETFQIELTEEKKAELFAQVDQAMTEADLDNTFRTGVNEMMNEPLPGTDGMSIGDLMLKVGEFAQGKAVFGALVICIVLAGLLLLANYYLPYRGLRWISCACTFTGFLVAAPLFVIHFLPGMVVQFMPEAAELSHVLDGFYSVMAPYHFMPLIIGLALAVVATLWKRIYRKQMAQQ